MRTLTGTDTTLVIQSPMWIGLLLVGAGIAITLGVFVRRWPRPVRLGAFLGTIVLLYGGWHLLRDVTTFETRGFYVDSFRGEQERIGWLQVSGVDVGGLKGAKYSEPDQLVFQLRNSREVGVDLSGLTPDEQARVVAFVKKRLKP